MLPLVGSAIVALASSSIGLLDQTPDGFNRAENKDEGYAFVYPQSYKEIPRQPGDSVLLARYARSERMELPKSAPKGATAPLTTIGEMFVITFDKPKEGDTTAAQGSGGESATGSDVTTKAHDAAEALTEALGAADFEEFVNKRFKKWGISKKEEKADSSGKRFTVYSLKMPPTGPAQFRGAAWIYEKEDRLLGLLGVATDAQFDAQRRLFEKSALSLKEIRVSESAAKEMERYYSMHAEFKDPGFRIERRRSLTRGWKSIDTPHYLILHHSNDEDLLSRIQNDVEAMRVLYEQMFPPVRPVEAVSVIRVCKDRREYLQYGGYAMSAGYWNAAQSELVIYDNVKGEQGSALGNRDSYITLYHEAFHQFIHYSAGELPPHYWFNEGFGDYFSGAKVYAHSKKVQEIGLSPWRVQAVKTWFERGQCATIEKLVHMEGPEFMQHAEVYYPQAWSLVFFLNQGLGKDARPEWKQILPRYFEELKRAYAEELSSSGSNPTLATKISVGAAARKQALEVAFKNVDFNELESAWEKFVAKLR
jgi:hypothetical protein